MSTLEEDNRLLAESPQDFVLCILLWGQAWQRSYGGDFFQRKMDECVERSLLASNIEVPEDRARLEFPARSVFNLGFYVIGSYRFQCTEGLARSTTDVVASGLEYMRHTGARRRKGTVSIVYVGFSPAYILQP